MKNIINGVITGKNVNFSINGKLFKKTFETIEEARELFNLVLLAKNNPTDDNIQSLKNAVFENRRVAIMAGIDFDDNTGKCYIAGFNTPIPDLLLDVIKEYNENNYPMESIINFWKLLMVNPDVRIRESLFGFIQTHDFVLTDKGYMLVYKAVYRKQIETDDNETSKIDNPNKTNKFQEYILNQYFHVKKTWKSAPRNYYVYSINDSEEYKITEIKTLQGFDLTTNKYNVYGNLEDLYKAISKTVTEPLIIADQVDLESTIMPIYTDMYTRTMSIEVGKPVQMDRNKCDGDPGIDCSYGLHVGATKYVEHYAKNNSVILPCLVNPANVVAVPNYDMSKIRVSEYYPFAIATYDYNTKKIEIDDQKYYEDDYISYEIDELEKQIALIKEKELPIANALKSDPENRPMSELMKIISDRLIDISK